MNAREIYNLIQTGDQQDAQQALLEMLSLLQELSTAMFEVVYEVKQMVLHEPMGQRSRQWLSEFLELPRERKPTMNCGYCQRLMNYCFYVNDAHWIKVVGEEKFDKNVGHVCAHCALERLGGLGWYIIWNEPTENIRQQQEKESEIHANPTTSNCS